VKETIEREVKLTAGEGFVLPELGGQTMPTRVFVSTYHDTAGLTLARHGVTFRHRLEEGAGVWQLKLPHADARLELERPGTAGVVPPELLELLPALLRGEKLVPVARLRTRREVIRAAGAEVVDDSVAVLDRQHVTRRFRELEVELLDGDEQTLRRLETALRRAGAGGMEFRPKLYQALDLVYPREPVAVPGRTSPAEALALRLADQVTTLLTHDPGTRLGSDPEDLHQLRVATRRLRAYLRAARPLLEEEEPRVVREELAWLGSALGPVRDLDVLIAHFEDELRSLDGDGDAAGGLVATLSERRLHARETLLERLSSDRYFALLDLLRDFVARPPLSGDETPLAAIWWKEVKRLRRGVAALAQDPADEALHEIRIHVKRSRYAAELGAHELGKAGARFVAAAKAAQDVLGAHQDSVVAEHEILAWAGDEVNPTADRLVQLERARRADARSAWPGAWSQLWKRARAARR
jgi:CHAD domain-containing protein